MVGGNEAGMYLGGDVRAAEAAVWRRADVGSASGRPETVAPLLAVEVAGQDQGEPELRTKAQWYLDHGVSVVWLVLPHGREVVVVTPSRSSRHGPSGTLPAHPLLPDLTPSISAFFAQLDAK